MNMRFYTEDENLSEKVAGWFQRTSIKLPLRVSLMSVASS